MEAFEGIVKKHVVNGSDIHTAFGRAIKESPDAYCRYLKEDALSDAEVRMGEILEGIPKIGRTAEYGSSGGTIPSLPSDITKKQSHQAQTMAAIKRGSLNDRP